MMNTNNCNNNNNNNNNKMLFKITFVVALLVLVNAAQAKAIPSLPTKKNYATTATKASNNNLNNIFDIAKKHRRQQQQQQQSQEQEQPNSLLNVSTSSSTKTTTTTSTRKNESKATTTAKEDKVARTETTTTTTATKSKSNNTMESAWISGVKNFVASGMAAACSKLILAPFDTIKTIQQHSRTTTSAALSFSEAATVIMQRPKGFLEFYAGIGVAVIGSMPSVGLYFGVYSFCKRHLQEKNPNHPTLNIALSAAIGNTIASSARVPYEVIKQKLQTGVYTSMGDALKEFMSPQGIKTIFPTGGIASQMLRDIPYAIVTLLCYEHLKSVWKPKAQTLYPQIPIRSWDLLVGGTSGGIGSFMTNPMDVIKTRLQTSSELYDGSIRTCFLTTFQEGGPQAFLRGSIPRLLHKVPANAFFFLFYEFFRTVLQVQEDDNTTTTTARTKTMTLSSPPPPPSTTKRGRKETRRVNQK